MIDKTKDNIITFYFKKVINIISKNLFYSTFIFYYCGF